MKTCELYNLIPKEKLDYLFSHSNAEVELDPSFLGFEDIYRDTLKYVSNNTTIIDLGCAYATQSYYFKDCSQYIGVDIFGNDDSVIHTDNSRFYFTSIQDFIEKVLPTLSLDLNSVFAICSYVPDNEARNLVIETFPNGRVYYPGAISVLNLSNVSYFEKSPLDEQITKAKREIRNSISQIKNETKNNTKEVIL